MLNRAHLGAELKKKSLRRTLRNRFLRGIELRRAAGRLLNVLVRDMIHCYLFDMEVL